MQKPNLQFSRPFRWRRFSFLSVAALVGIGVILPVPGFSSRPFIDRGVAMPELRILSESDRTRYRQAFALEQSGRTDEAQQLLAHVENPILKDAWRETPAKTGDAKFHRADAIVTSQGKSRLHDGENRHWTLGLAAFRKHDMTGAAEQFRAVLQQEKELPAEDRATVAFWAYRSLAAAGEKTAAETYLAQAAAAPPGFYSMLARGIRDQAKELRGADEPGMSDVRPILRQPGVRRAVALKEIGQDALAEEEIRALYEASDAAERRRLSTLAGMLDLPAAQMQPLLPTRHTEGLNEAQYPTPDWTPAGGYHIEPALLFAIMRQESGFNPHAKSASGAMGVMQLMPATAQAMAQNAHLSGTSLEPAISMTLGQTYLQKLMGMNFIGDNLVFLTAAYNAGPGNVLLWQKGLRPGEDPLLFVESIPCRQTRDYVLHVLGNYWVYSQMLGREDASIKSLSQGEWPRYVGRARPQPEEASRELVDLISRSD